MLTDDELAEIATWFAASESVMVQPNTAPAYSDRYGRLLLWEVRGLRQQLAAAQQELTQIESIVGAGFDTRIEAVTALVRFGQYQAHLAEERRIELAAAQQDAAQLREDAAQLQEALTYGNVWLDQEWTPETGDGCVCELRVYDENGDEAWTYKGHGKEPIGAVKAATAAMWAEWNAEMDKHRVGLVRCDKCGGEYDGMNDTEHPGCGGMLRAALDAAPAADAGAAGSGAASKEPGEHDA